jgi:serine/threonine protein kinase
MHSSHFSPAGFARDTVEERAFFQARLTMFYRIGFALTAAEFVLAVIVFTLAGTTGPADVLFGSYAWLYPWVFQLATAALCFVLWQIVRRGEHKPAVLAAIDFGGVVILSLTYVGMSMASPVSLRPELFQLICITLLLGFRAAMVPSSAARTAAVGGIVIGAIVAFAFVYYSLHKVADGAPSPFVYAAFAGLLGSGSVAVTTITSNSLFGLRQKVREATQLGQYTLTERIGEGGMGVVYKAKHAMLCRPTAVKILPPDRAGAHNIARFEREVQLTSSLTHPNTVQIYDFGRTPEGTFYYAMEYLDGLTLGSLVELDGPQPVGRVISILAQVCGSLAEAHSIGLIHRDVKPENIMICERGLQADVVKVVDFGLVKTLDGPGVAKLSRTGMLAGTPLYMAPETIQSPDRVDARTDLYAVGAVGYFLVTGHNVFEGNSLIEIGAQHLNAQPELPSKRLGTPVRSDFEAVLLSCLAKSPDDRPRNADELRSRLLACADANTWTEKNSHDWWQSHRERIHEHKAALTRKSGIYDVDESGTQKRLARA